MEIDAITRGVLDKIDDTGFKQEGAYNLRYNGYALCRGDSEHIKIKKREDGHSGIDVVISSDTKGETVHIPVVITKTGITDVVYNDFYVEPGAEVTIVAGCGIHNSGCDEARQTAFIPSMWVRAPMWSIRKSTTEKGKAAVPES